MALVRAAETGGGRVHVTGIGKPEHVAHYAASLLSSTGTPATFLHGTEAVHGSAGQVVSGDVVIAMRPWDNRVTGTVTGNISFGAGVSRPYYICRPDYEEDLRRLVEEGKTVEEIYEALTLDDIRRAANLLRPVYDQTGGADGYVSLEVSPALAHDTEGTIAEA